MKECKANILIIKDPPRTDCSNLFVLVVSGFGSTDLLVLRTPHRQCQEC